MYVGKRSGEQLELTLTPSSKTRLCSWMPIVLSRARTTSASDGVYDREAILSISSRKLRHSGTTQREKKERQSRATHPTQKDDERFINKDDSQAAPLTQPDPPPLKHAPNRLILPKRLHILRTAHQHLRRLIRDRRPPIPPILSAPAALLRTPGLTPPDPDEELIHLPSILFPCRTCGRIERRGPLFRIHGDRRVHALPVLAVFFCVVRERHAEMFAQVGFDPA